MYINNTHRYHNQGHFKSVHEFESKRWVEPLSHPNLTSECPWLSPSFVPNSISLLTRTLGGSPSGVWETWDVFSDSNFDRAHSWPLQAFGKQSGIWKLAFSYSLLSCSFSPSAYLYLLSVSLLPSLPLCLSNQQFLQNKLILGQSWKFMHSNQKFKKTVSCGEIWHGFQHLCPKMNIFSFYLSMNFLKSPSTYIMSSYSILVEPPLSRPVLKNLPQHWQAGLPWPPRTPSP